MSKKPRQRPRPPSRIVPKNKNSKSSSRAKTTAAVSKPLPARERSLPSKARVPHLIVGVGASAGGLEAFSQLLDALPADAGIALVFVQHLSPSHTSVLPELLA